jgi:DUF4097 and DUF4098 domain-containing protein YvlB
MSSVPPNMPPGGTPPPYPPYDPKTQWRIYQEQQKAAWRAQRDAWKAQHYAAKAAYGPRVPSVVGPIILITIGIVAMMMATGHIEADQFWTWYGHWWPLLLIGAGLALLAEWALDLKRTVPVRRGGSFVGILILLAIVGLGAAGWSHRAPFFQWNGNDGDFFNSFGLPEHDFDQPVLSSQVPAKASIDIENPRGDVSVAAGEGATVEVYAHEVAYANSDEEAKKIFDAQTTTVRVSGNAVVVKPNENKNGRVNLTVTVPKTAWVTVNSGKGDVTAAGLGAGFHVSARGDVRLSDMKGSVDVRFSGGNHNFSAHQVEGDVSADGHCDDITVSEIKGKVTLTGEFFGETHLENVSGAVHLHTSVTDLEVASLPGDITLSSDDLHVNEAKGMVRVTTHSKDVDLNQIYGDIYAENRDGRIAVAPAGNYAVDAKNSKGDVEVSLPPNASASVNARTHNGDIVSDYAIPSTEGENKTVTFTIGSGGSRIALRAENGDVRIKKGAAFPAALSVPTVPKAPVAPNAPKLKTSKALPPHPVTQ